MRDDNPNVNANPNWPCGGRKGRGKREEGRSKRYEGRGVREEVRGKNLELKEGGIRN